LKAKTKTTPAPSPLRPGVWTITTRRTVPGTIETEAGPKRVSWIVEERNETVIDANGQPRAIEIRETIDLQLDAP
jgi:hypothetical protein